MFGAVQELLGVNEIIESTNTLNLGLIRDTTNLMARQARQQANMLEEIFRQSSQTEAAETVEVVVKGGQTGTTQTSDAVGISSAPLLE